VALAAVLAAGLALAGCTWAGAGGGTGDGTVTVGIVANPQMRDIQELTDAFHRDHPDIKVRYVTLPENEARARITQDVATKAGQFDVVMIGTYEAPIWGRNGWLTDLMKYARDDREYDVNDLIPAVRKGLSVDDKLYAVPFYGESSFLMYRKDLFAQAGLKMPDNPTWTQVAEFARKFKTPDRAGICLRGLPGWGEQLAPLDTVINTFGGRWYDTKWNAQLTAPKTAKAVKFYLDLVKEAGEAGAPNAGFSECLTAYGQGDAAMWYDATSAATSLEDGDEGVRLAVGVVARRPHDRKGPRRRLAVRALGDLEGVHPHGRGAARLGARAARQPPVHLQARPVREGQLGLGAGDAQGARVDRPEPRDRRSRALHGHPVRPDPGVPGPRDEGLAAVRRRARRQPVGGRRAQDRPGRGRGRRRRRLQEIGRRLNGH
jgi:spermidine/putrescine-binding protein